MSTRCYCQESVVFFLYYHPATHKFYTLSLHDALPISKRLRELEVLPHRAPARHALSELGDVRRELARVRSQRRSLGLDRKSTRLNSSHPSISYAVFCLKKKTDHVFMPVVFIAK